MVVYATAYLGLHHCYYIILNDEILGCYTLLEARRKCAGVAVWRGGDDHWRLGAARSTFRLSNCI
jgi:hypothetical protein